MPPCSTRPAPEAVVAEARSWIGTPWIDRAHVKGAGTDCIGLVAETYRAVGYMPDFVYPRYSRRPRGNELERYLRQYFVEVAKGAMQAGDVVLTAWRVMPTHLAILGDYMRHGGRDAPFSLIHALLEAGRVTEHICSEVWMDRIISAWRMPEAP